MDFKTIKAIAKETDWLPIKGVADPYMVAFSRSIDGHPARINVWVGKKGMTVGTYITHPKKGKSQLFRRHVNKDLLRKIFKNPRVHTAHGYSKK